MPTSTPNQREIVHWDPFVYHEDPFPLYRTLRDVAPVYRNDDHSFWAVSRFADVQALCRNWRRFSSAAGNGLDRQYEMWLPGSPESLDPPDHDRMRDVVRRHFSPRTIKEIEPVIRGRIDDLLAPGLEAGELDLARALAIPLPFSVICDLIGLPPSDHDRLRLLYEAMMRRSPGEAEVSREAFEARAELRDYILAQAQERHRRPTADLLTVLAAAKARGEIEEEEIVGMALILFVAGVITTTGLISNSLRTLADSPDCRMELAKAPSQLPAAIEELLRYEAPIQWLSRLTTERVELHGAKIPAGARVVLIFGSANRDERRWNEPDRLNFRREGLRNIAFGEGIHFCIGAPLARLEARLALEAVLSKMPRYEISGPVVPSFTPSERALESLPVTFAPTAP